MIDYYIHFKNKTLTIIYKGLVESYLKHPKIENMPVLRYIRILKVGNSFNVSLKCLYKCISNKSFWIKTKFMWIFNDANRQWDELTDYKVNVSIPNSFSFQFLVVMGIK